MELTRLRTLAPTPEGYDSLTDAEHLAVLDASDLADELRAAGYGFGLTTQRRLHVTTPASSAPPKDVAARVTALADALVYVLRIERWADPLPDACRRCGADVGHFSPNGHPYCASCYAVAEARALQKVPAGAAGEGGR